MNDREWVVQDRLINRAYNKCEEEKKREEDEDTDEVVEAKVKNGTQQPHVTRGPTSPVRTALFFFSAEPENRWGPAFHKISTSTFATGSLLSFLLPNTATAISSITSQHKQPLPRQKRWLL